MTQEKLTRLTSQRDLLNKKIQAEKTKLNAKQRRNDTRRKILWGVWVLKHMEKHPDFKTFACDDFYNSLTRQDERALFDLPPLSPVTPVLGQACPPRSAF